jgi:putative alpha-1,2-mannosidase
MAYPYLFTHFAGQAWRTQRRVRTALTQSFSTSPAGLPGNDDTGTLSAWFVFGALGFYPDQPGSLRYSLGSPLFDRVTLDLSDAAHPSRTFVIEARDNAPDRPYIGAAELDGVPHSTAELDHTEILSGGTLTLKMSAVPVP